VRIGIDARLNAYRGGGIAQYTRQLLAGLAPLAPDDTLVSLQHVSQRQPLVAAPNVQRATLFTPPHHRLESLALPVELLPRRLTLLHCPDFIAPRFWPGAVVVTIHDLAFLHYPDILDASARRYYGQVRASVWRASAVIADSESTRRDITHFLGLPPERVDVVYVAAASVFAPRSVAPGETRMVGQKWLLGPPTPLQAGSFALFVSTLEPRKNLPMLLRALRGCLDRQPGAGYRLVVAGARGWNDGEIFETVRELRLADAVAFTGSVSQDDLLWLYNACRFYVNPSLYEGFGLPVVEALACGTPTLAAASSSIPEVAGDAALLLPPHDVAAWAEAMERLWHDASLQHTLAQRGPLQAAQFSWERAARETLAIYRRVG
jgi:glycosyltransferase involved in cell wall biosynthesis